MTADKTQRQDVCINDPDRGRREGLRVEIAAFFRRRRVEAIAAASVVALSSYSQAYALSISEIKVQSALGQPLRATVDIGVAPGEIVNTRCLRVRPPKDGGMPGVGSVSLSMASKLNTVELRIKGAAPMREPMTEMVLSIECAGTPTMTRSFLVLLDPPSAINQTLSAAPPTAVPSSALPAANASGTDGRAAQPERASATVAPQARARARTAPNMPIEAGSRYVVQPGDILSVIASRVADRPEYSVWPIAQRIYDTNPHAFDSQTPDSLRVGAALDIPRLVGNLAVAGTPQQVRRVSTRPTAATSPRRVAKAARPTPRTNPPVTPAANPTGERAMRLVSSPRRSPIVLPRTIDTFAISPGLSALSLDRLRKRQLGKPVTIALQADTPVPPTDAITRRRNVDAEAAAETAADASGVEATPESSANELAPAAPIAAPAAATFAAPAVRIGVPGWIVAVAALLGAAVGGLGTMFGLRRWLASKRTEQEQAMARSKRHEQRLEESRRKRPSADAPAIVVQEQLPRVDISSADDIQTVGSVEEVIASGPDSAAIGALLKADQAGNPTASDADLQADVEDPSLTVDALDDNDELDFDVFEAPDASALELLAKDYAQTESGEPGDSGELQQDPEATTLLSPEQLGMSKEDTTQMLRGALDLELPEGNPEDTVMAVPGIDTTPDTIENDLTEAAIQLNADLLRMSPPADDDDPTSEAMLLSAEDADLLDEDPTTAIDTRDTEDYYHLEASSIRKVDSLAFEDDADDDDTRIVSSIGK